jgi:hypothetical protein
MALQAHLCQLVAEGMALIRSMADAREAAKPEALSTGATESDTPANQS